MSNILWKHYTGTFIIWYKIKIIEIKMIWNDIPEPVYIEMAYTNKQMFYYTS